MGHVDAENLAVTLSGAGNGSEQLELCCVYPFLSDLEGLSGL